jgi:hypothetical protein
MPRHTGLLKRNGRYYMNRRVPKDLHAVFRDIPSKRAESRGQLPLRQVLSQPDSANL